MVLRKDQLEVRLKDDQKLIRSGILRNEHPLCLTQNFQDFMQACRRGDLKTCQEMITAGVNINGKDEFDYTPLIVASLCGHYELVRLLLESGALADPESFEMERAVYNALNLKIRNLLLSYDYSKSTDPLQPWSSHITSLLTRQNPKTHDIELVAPGFESFHLHKFILSARSPYFRHKLAEAPETPTWRLPHAIPPEAFRLVLRYLYLGDLPRDLIDPAGGSGASEEEVARGIDKLCRQLQIERLWEAVLALNDRRLARQRHQDEVDRARRQVDDFFRETVLKHRIVVPVRRAGDVKWPHDNAIFANCLLRADEDEEDEEGWDHDARDGAVDDLNTIPVGPSARNGNGSVQGPPRKQPQAVLYPVHKAFLIRSPYFETMFSSSFKEAQDSEHLHIIKMDCTPQVLEIVLTFLYTEKADCPLDLGLDLLYTSDMLLLDKLKAKAALTISTLGSGHSNTLVVDRPAPSDKTPPPPPPPPFEDDEDEPIDIYDVIRAAWDLRVQRLEEFAARYLAGRLERHIDRPEFAELIRESASRIRERQQTDTIELLDDMRYYLSERFRMRFDGGGFQTLLGEEAIHPPEPATDRCTGADGAVAEGGNGEVVKTAAIAHEDRRAASQSLAWETTSLLEGEGAVRTLDGELVEDEFVSEALNYQILLGKIDGMLEHLKLDA